MRKELLSILALCILVTSTLVGCAPSTLTILSIAEGSVFVLKAGTDDWIEAEIGMSLRAGDTVKTGDNSSAQITFFEGSTMELEAATEMKIASLGASTVTGSTTITLEQTIGSIIFRVTKIIDPASRYEVETPAGVVAVRGSAVEVHVTEDGTTRVTNLEGDIWAIAQGVELQVPEEGRCVIRPGRPPELTIAFAVAGPMSIPLGHHQWWGAELARDDINAGGGVNVGGVYHGIELVQVDTNEFSGTPEESVNALEAVIDDVDFVVGGWRTDYVVVYREVATDAEKIFMNCGAATGFLQYSVVEDYDHYKYWFKIAPYNDTFLVKSLFRMTTTIGTMLKNTLLSYGDAVTADYRVPEDGKLRLAIIMEDALWCEEMVPAAQEWLSRYGFDVVGTWLVSPTATDITTQLAEIAAAKPHIVFTAFSGPVGAVYSIQKAALGISAVTIGINAPAQLQSHWESTEGECNGEIMLDTWAEGLENTAKTTAFLDAFVAKTGEYPVYSADTYNAIYCLKEAIEGVSIAHGWDDIADVVAPANIDALIQYLETSSYTGTSGTTVYYPMPDIDLGGGTHALSEAQVRTLYPSLATYNQTNWLCAASGGPHIAHDLVYGPGYATGIGSQWQDGYKVGVWPMDFGDEHDETLTDQYGCWNFEYPGTVDVVIPIEGFLA